VADPVEVLLTSSVPAAIPLWLKVAYSAFVGYLVPVYWHSYGPKNFLWFSDIALLGMVPALWLESSLLASMMAVGTLLPELFWNLGYFGRLASGRRLMGLTDYMFDAKYSLFLRALSLFHVFLPPLLLWTVWRLGYDARALVAQTLLAWIVLAATYVAKPDRNINWIYGFGGSERGRPRLGHLGLLFLFYPLLIYLPTHIALWRILG
jgi:hypothetical protein